MKKIIIALSFASFTVVGFSNHITHITRTTSVSIKNLLLEVEYITSEQDTNEKAKTKPVNVQSKNDSSKSAVAKTSQDEQTNPAKIELKKETTTHDDYYERYKIKDTKIIEQRKAELKDNSLKKERKKNPLLKEVEVNN